MNIEYVARNYPLGDAIRGFTESKLQKVTKFLEEPVEVRVTLEVEKHRQIAELHVAHRHGVLQAREETGDMRDTVNAAVDKVEKQARRARKRFMDRRRRADRVDGQQWPVAVVERGSIAGGGPPRIIEATALSIKPMTIEEAALALADASEGFVVFRDAQSDKVSVLYRRSDDNFGLISPEL
jgi:putative sigma-54 modulation protein